MNKLWKFPVSVVLLTLIVVGGAPTPAAAQGFKPGPLTIAEIALGDPGSFSTLVTALSCTGLVGAVADPDAELTVFAPTNAAFAGLGLDDDNVCDPTVTGISLETLTTVLLYHVVGERRPSPSVVKGRNKSIGMLAGGSIFPEGRGSLTVFDNLDRPSTITAADVLASNGIVHVIDNVLLPVAP